MEEEKKLGKIYKIIMVILITAFITFFVTSLSMYSYFTKNSDGLLVVQSDKSSTDLESKLSKFKSMIDKYFLGNVDENKLEEGAIKGYIEGLKYGIITTLLFYIISREERALICCLQRLRNLLKSIQIL